MKRMNEDLLNKMADVFIHLGIAEKYGISFGRYVEMWLEGTFPEYVL